MADYWRKQQPGQPLYGDILWSRPERRDQAGRLTIIGGNSHGFSAVASAYQLARQLGVGEVRAVIPDALGAKLPTAAGRIIYSLSVIMALMPRRRSCWSDF